jgi:hypothetical protein
MRVQLKPWIHPDTGNKLEAIGIKAYKETETNKQMVTFLLIWDGKIIGNGEIIWTFRAEKTVEEVAAEIVVTNFNYHGNGQRLPEPHLLIDGKLIILFQWDKMSLEKAIDSGELVLI